MYLYQIPLQQSPRSNAQNLLRCSILCLFKHPNMARQPNGLSGTAVWSDLRHIRGLPFASLQPAVNFYSGTVKSYLLAQYISLFLVAHKQRADGRDLADLKGLPVRPTRL